MTDPKLPYNLDDPNHPLNRISMEDRPETPPAYAFSENPSLQRATGILIGTMSKPPHRPKYCVLLDWQWTLVPWWVRLLGLIRLPYDLVKFVITGRFIFIPWPWRW